MTRSDDARLLSVGDVARRTGLSTKALRHYDRIDLLRPAQVDDASYRWYSPDQVAAARLIAQLRAVDVPLDDVRRCLTDGTAVPDVLKQHRARLEARVTRVRGQLHRLDHLINDGMDSPMATDQPTTTTDDEMQLAKDLFNGVWTWMERENRSPMDDDTMLHMAHASRYHWGNVGTAANFARGEWLCSRVYAVLRRGEPSRYHAQRVLDICEENGIGDWDLAFAYEALARAAAVSGDADSARGYTEQALAAAENIGAEEERELVLTDLESIPGQARFW
ncbi:MAG TPA: MerR family transcriptional regulator [Jatrophihabitantaceae bacterium]|nr:MerR family transcriptional regulator [Jatrophihabitantaceae bacterium]